MSKFLEIAEYLSEPLILLGLALCIVYGIFKKSIKKLNKSKRTVLTFRVINFSFVLIVLLLIFSMGNKFFKSNNDKYFNPYGYGSFGFLEVEDIKNKKTEFKFNIPDNDTLNVFFKGKKWKLETEINISENFKVLDLKNAIIQHFELEKYTLSPCLEDVIWMLKANHKSLNDTLTLKNAGVKNGDTLNLRVQSTCTMLYGTEGIDTDVKKKKED
jgi:hypothetical protein